MEWVKRHKWFFIAFILIVILTPFILHFLVFENSYPSSVSNDVWAGFFGGYIGAVIVAIATIIAITIEIEHNKSEKQKEEILSVRPYLYINIIFTPTLSKNAPLSSRQNTPSKCILPMYFS